MDTDTLRWFVWVADGATVAEAATRGHTTQPAVTRGLHRLAAQVGAPLTERVGRRLRLTLAGETFADHARRIVTELDAATRAIGELGDPVGGTVRLGFLSPLGTWLIPQLLIAFHAERPAVRFELRHDGAARILQALQGGDLDMLISVPPSGGELSWEPLFSEELRLAVPAGHRLAHRRHVRVAELEPESWVLLPPGYGLAGYVADLCAEAGFAPRRAFEGPDLQTLFALIGAGSGIGLFPTRPQPPADVRQLPLSPRVERPVGLTMRPGRAIPSAAAAFAELVRDRAAALAASG